MELNGDELVLKSRYHALRSNAERSGDKNFKTLMCQKNQKMLLMEKILMGTLMMRKWILSSKGYNS